MNRAAVEAGLSALETGEDFANGAIAYEGEWLRAEEVVFFDFKGCFLLQEQGNRAPFVSHPLGIGV